MVQTFQISVALLAVIAILGVVARRLVVPPAIVLVIAGFGLAFVPGLPEVRFDPQLVLLLFLPPLVYDAGVAMSWGDFRAYLRPILSLALGGVAFTTCAVAAMAHWTFGLAWPVAFVLGSVVSPPDEVAAIAIAERLNTPRQIDTILEGEGLVNDATALTFYRFALVAAGTGAFSLWTAAGEFAAILVCEPIYGVAVGWAMTRLRHWIDDPRVEVTLSLVTPFVAYWPAEAVGGSGVLAAVSAGLYVSARGSELIPYDTRLQGALFWDIIVYLADGLLFLTTGLQAQSIIAGLNGLSWHELLTYGVITSLVVIAVRFAWVFPATYLTWLVRSVRKRAPFPPWQQSFVVAFAGMRGAISLAAALAIPFSLAGGQPFPNRNLILFLTFCVILSTLVLQGLSLPAVIRWLGLAERGREEHWQERRRALLARLEGAKAALERIEQLRGEQDIPPETLGSFRALYELRMRQLRQYQEAQEAQGDIRKLVSLNEELARGLIEAERARIQELRRQRAISDDARRRIERELDLEEARVLHDTLGL